MFRHIFIYRLKVLLRSKSMIFWTLLFPILLAIFFKLSLGGLYAQESFKAIDIAIVEDLSYQEDVTFKTVMESVSSGDAAMFNLTLTTLEKAEAMLDDGDIKGYIKVEETKRLVVNDSGIYQSILKSFLDQYSQSSAAVERVLKVNPSALQATLEALQKNTTTFKTMDSGNVKLDMTLNYFYGLIAMTCLYGSFFGMNEVNNIQANLSVHAARVNVAPVHKLKTFLYSGAAALLVQILELLLFLVFLVMVLKVDFGPKLGRVILTTLMGALVGVSFGAFVSALVKGGEGIKMAILLGVSMTGAMLSGMMFGDMKYIIATKAPLLALINPVNLLADSFYALYFYDTNTRYFTNMIGLSIFSIVFCLGTYLIIRRQKYASI